MDPLAPLLQDYGGGHWRICPNLTRVFIAAAGLWASLLILFNKQPVYSVLGRSLSEPRNKVAKRVNSRNVVVFKQVLHCLARMIFYLAGLSLRLLARR